MSVNEAVLPAAARAAGIPATERATIPVGIVGTGAYAPSRVVGNAEIVRDLDTTEAWIESRTGIRERRFAADGEATSDMCVHAARQALDRAGVRPQDVDVVIVSTITADQPLPSTAVVVADQLGATHAWPIDLTQAACAGGVHGMLLGASLLHSAAAETVLVIGADLLSRITDPADRTTRVFFGDAAGALVLRRATPGAGILSWDIGYELSHRVGIATGGSRRPATPERIDAGEHLLRMDGRAVWNQATAALPASISAVIAKAGLTVADIDHFVLHQANLNIVHQVMDVLGARRERALTTVEHLGNTGSATVFTVLDGLFRADRLRPGDLAVVSAIGAGFMWGTLCLRQV
jgi:3-oxoacyl-[acyl-carrier-protein] synthase-3